MFARPILSAETALKNQETQLIPQTEQPCIDDGLYLDEAKLIATSQRLYSYNRKALDMHLPKNAKGFNFGYDKTIPIINPAKAISNPPTPPEVLARIAMPDQPKQTYSI